jgi:toxin FitB
MELLVEEGRTIGHTFSQPALSIAATAQHYDLTTVSRDTSDFEKARVTVFNP